MATISDSSQEASNAASNIGLTIDLRPNIFLKNDSQDVPPTGMFSGAEHALKSTPLMDQSQKRRSSSRSIKRKKFDDELVESSLIKTSRPRSLHSSVFPVLSPALALLSPNASAMPSCAPSTSHVQVDSVPAVAIEKRRSRPPQKRIKKPKTSLTHITKDVSRWKPSDDLTLILSVQHTYNLENVYRGVKFSSKFTLREVQERWYALLYDVSISKAALFAVKQLNPDIVAQIKAKLLFSEEEEKLVASITSDKGSLEVFQSLLESNASMFLPSRTAKVLLCHWTLMKQYNLLQDQVAHQPGTVESLLSFSDTEELLDDSELQDPKDSALDEETLVINRKHLLEVKQLENQVPKWQVLVDCVTGVSLADFDSKTLAVLRGRIVRYLIQSREVTFGRSAKDNNVDIDLSLEGPAWKISRRQGLIKMDNNGEFYLINDGKKPIFVDGKPVLNSSKFKLNNNSVIEITVLRFIFIVNQEAITALRAKMTA